MAVRIRLRRWWSGWLCLLIPAAIVAGCGGTDYQYVTNSADHTYLKIPNSWRPIDQQALDTAFNRDPSGSGQGSGMWMVGYDAETPPSAGHLVGADAASPVALVRVESVPEEARGQFSLDLLRDLYLPVTPASRQLNTGVLTDFGLLSDEVLTPKGLHGVHTIYQYRISGGPQQTFDLTAYVNADSSKLYVLFLRCSAQCYQQRQSEIQSVVSSFTVRETP